MLNLESETLGQGHSRNYQPLLGLLGCLVWECPCPGALPYTNSFYSLPNGVQQKKKKEFFMAVLFWFCTTLAVIGKLKYPPNRGTYQCWAGIKMPLSSTWSQWSSYCLFETFRVSFSKIPGLNPWSPVLTCMRKTRWMKKNWIQKNKFKYWDPKEIKPLTWVKIQCPRFNA